MPIVSEDPRSVNVLQRISRECDPELEHFVTTHVARRRAYLEASDTRRELVRTLELEERPNLDWRELCALLRSREAAAEELRTEMETMCREIMLLKREMRETRRKLLSGTRFEEPEPERPATREDAQAAAGRATQRVQQSIRYSEKPTEPRLPAGGGMMQSLKPWLRGFLPNSG